MTLCIIDRNKYVRINWANIASGWSNNFSGYKSNQVATIGSYDYGSVMHYSRCAASKNNRETITPKVGGGDFRFCDCHGWDKDETVLKCSLSIPQDSSVTTLGQRNGMSNQDISKLMTMYSCSSG